MRPGHPSEFGPVLVGMRGCGKTTVAPLVAEMLHLASIDTDAEVERRTGKDIPEIFRRHGQGFFRRAERELVLELLQQPGLVVAAGGGAVLDAQVRSVMRLRPTVWLHAPVATLAGRIAGTNRPSLTGKPAHQELAEVLTEREQLYAEVAAFHLDTDRHTPRQVARLVAQFWLGLHHPRQLGGS